ncbi:tRNA threonylcarbamoyladenosine biosynthesis protein TsaE [Jeotgalibaca dankookensis]|uniref:tRNA threonylcarbamoyladenosine biosynthesis protein TsaE n=1 Tax=Jeotgalibaca dankookensis TaxID=708126 RepID=A0A1S6IQ48_9LACT|nr:tRNA (adenosine(37)-N6)-threonylcarbamoyltransferase complex ATPase subunit type 1 TsaE [Jeotgalibaca dankookensis]AQS53649.1 tRNA threonylcarbamoyladenosine biosynthesis protein TsaE [Jeotgalibaca dankookensis]
MTYVFETIQEAETLAFAKLLGERVQPGDVILLEGDLGSGKTTFTKGLAKGMGIDQIIKSPTYTLIREYTKGRLPLYHLDVYRLEEAGGEGLGLEEYFYGKGVSVVEWSKFISEDLPTTYLLIEINKVGEEMEKRRFTVQALGERYEKLLLDWKDVNEN